MPLDYYMSLFETCRKWGDFQRRQFLCRPPHPHVVFRLVSMLQYQGCATAAVTPDKLMMAPESTIIARTPVWPHLESLGLSITREQADAAVTDCLSGYIFGVSAAQPLPDPEICPPPLLCIEPALTLGVLARVSGCFYRASQLPDYGISHLASTTFLCCDSRISLDCCVEHGETAQ